MTPKKEEDSRRQTKMAYVDIAPKVPRTIRNQQAKQGTALPSGTPLVAGVAWPRNQILDPTAGASKAYNTKDHKSQCERPEVLPELFYHPFHPSFKNGQRINYEDPLGLCNPLSDEEYRAFFEASQRGKQSSRAPFVERFSNKNVHQSITESTKKDSGVEKDILEEDLYMSDCD